MPIKQTFLSTYHMVLLSSCACIVFTGAAAAQIQTPDTAEEIEVIGQALALKRALEVKRLSTNIVDATVQDDIGRLPDLNTAEILRRITGVAVQNDQAEARFPIIRGFNPTFNRTTIDGGVVASPERGANARAVPLDVIPASLLGRLEVIKSVTPELDANAIGGTINVVTRSAFDEEEPFLYGAGFLGFHGQSGDGGTLENGDRRQPWRLNFAGGTTFGADDQFGIVVGFDYSVRNFEIPQIEVDDADYTEFNDAGENVGIGNGNGFIIPTNNRVFFYNNVRERIGGSVKLEWQPTSDIRAGISGLFTQFNDAERRDEIRYELGTSGSSGQPDTLISQSGARGETQDGFAIIGLGRFTLDRQIYNIQGDIEWDATEHLTLDLRATYSAAELDNPESTEAFQTDTSFGAAFDANGFFPRTFPFNNAAYTNPQSFAHQNRGELERFAQDDIFEIAANGRYELDSFAVKFGGQYRKIDKAEGFTFNRFVADEALGYTLADAADTGLAGYDFQGGYDFPVRVDSDGATAFFSANTSEFSTVLTTIRGSEAQEEVFAGYAQGSIEFGDASITGGVRVEHTKWNGGPTGGDQVSGSYTNYLPSVVARYNMREDLVVRLAASRTLGRPDINDLTRGVSINESDSIVTRSNPDLDPRISTNIDLAVEWYIPDGILAAGVFYKDIKNEIFVRSSNVPVTVGSISFENVNQPENAANAQLLGIEAQYQQTFTFLPAPFDGLGLSANLTWLDTELDVPLANGAVRQVGFFQQPELTYNITGFYATQRFEVRASYNYTGDFLDLLNVENPNRDEYWDARGQLDVQGRFNVTDQVSLVFEAVNITDQGRSELTGPNRDVLQENARFGRTFWFGVNFAL